MSTRSQSMPTGINTLFYDQLNKSFLLEWQEILRSERLGRHLVGLIDAETKKGIDRPRLLSYGMTHLPHELERPDKALATFFLVVSSLDGLPADVRDLAMDCMTYCETETYDGLAIFEKQLLSDYKKLAPMLDTKA